MNILQKVNDKLFPGAKEYPKNSVGKNIALGLQHAFAMSCATILVPLLTGLDVGVALCMAGVGTLCIRIPREIRNSTAGQLWHGSPESMLILSPPGMGKTTLVREIARLASEDGYNVAIADERRELAACREGIPQFDLGPNTDVMDGCPKAIAMELLLRACAPQMIVADEIGGEADAAAIRDAARCGAAVVATAHAASFVDAENRFRGLFQEGIFCRAVLLGPEPGRINSVREYGSEGE